MKFTKGGNNPFSFNSKLRQQVTVMTKETGLALLQPFIQQAKKDGDPFLFAHFSKQDDYLNGAHEGMEQLDAMILMRELVEFFDMTEIDALALNFRKIKM